MLISKYSSEVTFKDSLILSSNRQLSKTLMQENTGLSQFSLPRFLSFSPHHTSFVSPSSHNPLSSSSASITSKSQLCIKSLMTYGHLLFSDKCISLFFFLTFPLDYAIIFNLCTQCISRSRVKSTRP